MLGEQRGRAARGSCRGSASISPAIAFSSVDLPGPVAAHQRDPLARVRVQRHALRAPPARRAARPTRPRPRAARVAPLRAARQPPRARRGAAAPRRRSTVGGELAARLLHRHGRARQAGEREQLRGRRRARAGQPRARRLVGHDAAVAQLDHAVGGGQAALEPVLGEQDRGPPLLVEPPQDAEQLVARDRVQLRGRLVEQQQPRAAGERGGERDALQLAAATARASGGRAGRRARARARPPRPRARRPARPSRGSRAGTPARPAPSPSRPASRGPGTASRRPRRAAPARARGCRARRSPRARANVPPWKCGTSPHAARSSVDLPEPGAAGEQHQLARLDRQRHVVERRPRPRPG